MELLHIFAFIVAKVLHLTLARCFVSIGVLVKLVKPSLVPDNHMSFLLHIMKSGCSTGGYWSHATHQEHFYKGNRGVS